MKQGTDEQRAEVASEKEPKLPNPPTELPEDSKPPELRLRKGEAENFLRLSSALSFLLATRQDDPQARTRRCP